MTIKPLFDKVVLKAAQKEAVSKSGIILAAAAQEKPDFLEIVAVGEGAYVDGKIQPMSVKLGQKVLVTKFSGTQVKVDEEEYTIVSEKDILAVIE